MLASDSLLTRHDIIISKPIVRNGKMFVTILCKDWDKDLGFLYNIDLIDNKKLYCHIVWKLSIYENYCIYASALLNLNEKDATKLFLTDWRFN